MYHLPIRRGDGFSWGPRSEGKAFGTLPGSGGYREFERKRDDNHRGDLEWGAGTSHEMNTLGSSGEYANGTVAPSSSARQGMV